MKDNQDKKCKLSSAEIRERIASVASEIASLERERAAEDQKATELVSDDDAYLAACGRVGTIDGKIAELKGRSTRFEVALNQAITAERCALIAELRSKVNDARLKMDSTEKEVETLIKKEKLRFEKETTRLEIRRATDIASYMALMCGVSSKETDALQEKWNACPEAERSSLESRIQSSRGDSAEYGLRKLHHESLVAHFEKILACPTLWEERALQ